ncbi:MAG: hypothetical protein QF780_06470 [Candidatus Marinimicrobia bacterium]|nr:hypothetical protein [Candidatus Neomarinimicrobiota bacterium]
MIVAVRRVINNDVKYLMGSFPWFRDRASSPGIRVWVMLHGGPAYDLKIDVACCMGR